MSDQQLTTADVLHLGELARITLDESEAETLKEEIGSILGYVEEVSEIAADGVVKAVGARYNVLREDVVTNEPGAHTEDLLNSAPDRDGQYLKVKKILGN